MIIRSIAPWAPLVIFFFNDTATTEIYTLSLHDALPISYRLDCFYYAGHFMSWQIIHDDDVAATEGSCEALFDVRQEDGAVHRSINHEGSDNPVVAQPGDESHCFPMSMWNRCDQPLPARATTSEPHHVCAGSGLVDKHQPSGVKHALLSSPTSAGASDIGSFLLCRVQAFF